MVELSGFDILLILLAGAFSATKIVDNSLIWTTILHHISPIADATHLIIGNSIFTLQPYTRELVSPIHPKVGKLLL